MNLSKKDKQGIALIILTSGIMLLLAITPIILKKQALAYDPQSFCLLQQPYPHTVLLVDKTDTLSASQRDYLHALITKIKQTLQPREKLSIYILDHTNYTAPTPIFAMCNPGTGQQANEIYQNPAKIQHRFDEFFGKPLTETLQTLTKTTTSPLSPILEMLDEVARIADFNATQPRRLILVSDLLQNMPNDSHYRVQPQFQQWLRKHPIQKPLWNNTLVELVYLRHPQHLIQGAEHLDFWQQYFHAHGAQLAPVTTIR